MKRVNLYITEKQYKQLKKQAEKKEIRVSELIRNIFDKHFKND